MPVKPMNELLSAEAIKEPSGATPKRSSFTVNNIGCGQSDFLSVRNVRHIDPVQQR